MIPQPPPSRFYAGLSQQIWDGLINRYGEYALLRQTGLADRWVVSIFGQFTAFERLGGISNPADLKALISTISPDTGVTLTPNPSERDVLVRLSLDSSGNPLADVDGNPIVEQYLKIVAPPTPIGTRALSKNLYWRLQVRR